MTVEEHNATRIQTTAYKALDVYYFEPRNTCRYFKGIHAMCNFYQETLHHSVADFFHLSLGLTKNTYHLQVLPPY